MVQFISWISYPEYNESWRKENNNISIIKIEYRTKSIQKVTFLNKISHLEGKERVLEEQQERRSSKSRCYRSGREGGEGGGRNCLEGSRPGHSSIWSSSGRQSGGGPWPALSKVTRRDCHSFDWLLERGPLFLLRLVPFPPFTFNLRPLSGPTDRSLLERYRFEPSNFRVEYISGIWLGWFCLNYKGKVTITIIKGIFGLNLMINVNFSNFIQFFGDFEFVQVWSIWVRMALTINLSNFDRIYISCNLRFNCSYVHINYINFMNFDIDIKFLIILFILWIWFIINFFI